MKCISCGTDNILKERTANMGRCKSCDHLFAFEPTAMPTYIKITDPLFAKLIIDISANNTLFFTPRQLYYLLSKRLRSRFNRFNIATNPAVSFGSGLFLLTFVIFWVSGFLGQPYTTVAPIIMSLYTAWFVWILAQNALSDKLNRHTRKKSITTLKVIAGVLLLVGLPLSIIIKSSIGILAATGLGIASISLSGDCQRQQNQIFDNFLIYETQFQVWFDRWVSINRQPAKILPPLQTSSLPAIPNPEVTAYSFDRVVICDKPTIAQLLISNNFHFENNCAILTIDGYPQSIFTIAMEMLRRNPDLAVVEGDGMVVVDSRHVFYNVESFG